MATYVCMYNNNNNYKPLMAMYSQTAAVLFTYASRESQARYSGGSRNRL